MIEVYFFRHAQSEKNMEPEIIGGRSNESPITMQGRIQAERLRDRVRREGIAFDEFYSSPAVRCLETAKIAFPEYKPIIDNRLQEQDQGEWTGRKRSEIYTPEQIRVIEEDNWNFKAPGGESQAEVANRMYMFLFDKIFHNDGKRIGISTHGGSIKFILTALLELKEENAWKIPIENTSITQLANERKFCSRWFPRKINDCGHLYV